MNPVTTLTILAEMKIFETLVPLPVAIQLLKLWAPQEIGIFSGISCWKKEEAERSLVLPRGIVYLQEKEVCRSGHLVGQAGAETIRMGGVTPGPDCLVMHPS